MPHGYRTAATADVHTTVRIRPRLFSFVVIRVFANQPSGSDRIIGPGCSASVELSLYSRCRKKARFAFVRLMTEASVDSTEPRSQRYAPADGAETRQNPIGLGERRDSMRQMCGGAVWWKGQDNREFRQGWLVERSSDGAAFLIRGTASPLEGTRIELSTSDPTDVGFRIEQAMVTRMKHVHADLFLVATQLKTARP